MTNLGKRDRTVHAIYPGMQIVRYDRSGKWYLEPIDPSLKRQAVTLAEAAKAAWWGINNDGHVFFNKPGGSAFDRAVHKLEYPR